MSAIDTLESKLSRYSIPNLTLILLAGQFLALITTTIKPQSLSNYLLNGHALFSGQVWRAVTFLFVPVETNYFFAAFFFLMFYYFGTALEHYWGDARYNLYIGTAALATVIAALIFPALTFTNTYLFLSILLAYAYVHPDHVMYVFFVLPIKLRWIAYLLWLFFAYGIIFGSGPARLTSLISVANFFLFFGGNLMGSAKLTARNRHHQIASSIAPYHHKCAVCLKTDASHPDLDFRYCPDCDPPTAYCPNHISAHHHSYRH